MAKKLKSKKKAKVDPGLIDYYALFGIDRSLDNDEILVHLRQEMNKIRKKQQMCQVPEDITKLKEFETKILDALNIFGKKESRKVYDDKLDSALESGSLDTTAQKVAEDIYAEIERMFDMNNYNGVIRKCQELLAANSHETRIYSYLVRSLYLIENYTEAIKAVNACIRVHPTNIEALQLGARYYMMCNKDAQRAQVLVNHMLKIDPQNPIAINEQAYIYLAMGKKDIAFKIYDKYISLHPSDNIFRKACAVDLINYSYTLFVKDEEGTKLLISQEAYEECLALVQKAASIYDNEDIRKHLEYTKHFGEIEFNLDNKEALMWMGGCTILYFILGIVNVFVPEMLPVGLAVVALAGLLGYATFALYQVSKRPYWQIYRYKLTGYRDKKEKILVLIGKIFTGYMRWGIKAGWWVVKFAIKLALPG